MSLRCALTAGPRSKGWYGRKVRHLSVFGRLTRLLVRMRRFRCASCQKSFLPDLPGIRPYRHSTEPFRREVAEEHHRGICARQLAKLKRLGDATVGRIYQEHTCRQTSERESRTCPRVLGIDAHTLHGGQRWVTTFCDLKNRRLFDLAEGATWLACVSDPTD
ncbi:MAG: transposase family protein [Opitutales bacterium]